MKKFILLYISFIFALTSKAQFIDNFYNNNIIGETNSITITIDTHKAIPNQKYKIYKPFTSGYYFIGVECPYLVDYVDNGTYVEITLRNKFIYIDSTPTDQENGAFEGYLVYRNESQSYYDGYNYKYIKFNVYYNII